MIKRIIKLSAYLIFIVLINSCNEKVNKGSSLKELVDKINWLETPKTNVNYQIFRDSLKTHLYNITGDSSFLFIIECVFSMDEKVHQGAICYFRQNKRLIKTVYFFDKLDLYRNLPNYEVKRIRKLSSLVFFDIHNENYCFGSEFCENDILNFYYIINNINGSIQFLSPHDLRFEKKGPLSEIYNDLLTLMTFSKTGIPFCVNYF